MKTKRWVAALLCFLLIGSLFPANAFAAGGVIGGKYTLTLDENWEGGMGQVIPNTTSYVLPSVTRPGETFYGWATVPDGTVRYLAGDTVTLTDNLTLYAVWTFTQTFSITVQDGDGGSAFCDRSFAAAGETVTLTATQDVGYSFKGWQVISPNGLTITGNTFIMPNTDVTVKAVFGSPILSPYRVHIQPGEGSGTAFAITNETTLLWQQYQAGTYDETKGTFFKNESGELFYEFPKQCPFTAPEGKVFDCWQASTTKDNLGSYSGGYIVDQNVFPQDYTGGITIRLTALWKDAEQSAAYSITVESSNGGTATADKAAYEKGETVTLTATPAAGYHFKEWQSSDVTVSGNTFTMPEKDVTVKAVFEVDTPVTYTVSFDMNGHGTAPADQTVKEGEKATKPAVDPTAEGWTFDGWYADATFSAAFDFTAPITANTTVYAKWTENSVTPPDPVTYTIITGAKGEWTKGSSDGLAITSDAPFAKFDSVQVDGSTIAAANYTAVEGSTKITLAPAYLETLSVGSHSIKIVSSDGSASTSFTVKAAAQPPVPAKYTVSFNMNGHGTQVPAQTVEEGNKAAKPADPSASGYTFDGWYADATFSAKFDFSSAINANTTVYAKWTEVKKDEPTKPADPTSPTQPTKPADPTSPQTGDNSHLFLWIALLLISGGALAGTAVYGKKRKYNAK